MPHLISLFKDFKRGIMTQFRPCLVNLRDIKIFT
jgi:hypothetical protein